MNVMCECVSLAVFATGLRGRASCLHKQSSHGYTFVTSSSRSSKGGQQAAASRRLSSSISLSRALKRTSCGPPPAGLAQTHPVALAVAADSLCHRDVGVDLNRTMRNFDASGGAVTARAGQCTHDDGDTDGPAATRAAGGLRLNQAYKPKAMPRRAPHKLDK